MSSNVHEPIDFGDLTPIEIPYNILGRTYVLREASEGAVCSYRNYSLLHRLLSLLL